MPNTKLLRQKGFTLIELLVVVSVIGALAGILLNVIDSQKQQQRAEDSVLRNDINGVANSLEGFRTAEGFYPDQGTVNNPLDSSAIDAGVTSVYLSEWPTGLVYLEDGTDFSVHVQKTADTNFIKYNSIWREIRECADTTTPTSISDCD